MEHSIQNNGSFAEGMVMEVDDPSSEDKSDDVSNSKYSNFFEIHSVDGYVMTQYFYIMQNCPRPETEASMSDDEDGMLEKRLQLEYHKKIMGMSLAEQERYEACEHEDIADNIKLKFYGRGVNPPSANANEQVLKTSHGPPLTFGRINALAGDFYGVPEQPITLPDETELGNITQDREQRAWAAFKTIGDWTEENFVKMRKELTKNSRFIAGERKYLEEGGAQKSSDSYGIITYHGFKDMITEAYAKNATGHFLSFGIANPKHGGRLKKLLENNYDHFQPYAKVAYEVFHKLALEEAKKARQDQLTPNEKNDTLEYAYAIEAFGCHFLGDCFASGHMRVPRRELPASTKFAIYGHRLSNKMHDEYNQYGLRVTSKMAEETYPENPYWIAYGDKMLHHKKNYKNFQFAIKAIQCAVDEVFQAAQNEIPELGINDSKVSDFIPYIDTREGMNNTPMFQVRGGEVCRRKKLKDLQCSQEPLSNDNWNSLSTLSKLDRSKPRHSVDHPIRLQ